MNYKPNMPSYPEYELYDKVYLKEDDKHPWWVLGFVPHFGYSECTTWSYLIARPVYGRHTGERLPPERWTNRTDMDTLLVTHDRLFNEEIRAVKRKEELRLKIADAQAELDRLLALDAAKVCAGESHK